MVIFGPLIVVCFYVDCVPAVEYRFYFLCGSSRMSRVVACVVVRYFEDVLIKLIDTL